MKGNEKQAWCQSQPAACLKEDIQELKADIANNQEMVELFEKDALENSRPDCTSKECEEAAIDAMQEVEKLKEKINQQKKKLRDMERDLDEMQRSPDGGSGGSSGGGSSGGSW